MSVDNAGPSMLCMQQLGASRLSESADATFGSTVLMVSIDATVGDVLPGVFDGLLEGWLGKSAVVRMIVKDLHTVMGSKPFESNFGFQNFSTSIAPVHMDIVQPGPLVHEYGGFCVPSVSECPFCLGNESSRGGFEGVD
jgi:hypothetical protein